MPEPNTPGMRSGKTLADLDLVEEAGVVLPMLTREASAVIRVAASMSWLTFLLLAVVYAVLWRGGPQSGAGDATSVLLVPLSFVPLVLLRPDEHPLTTDMLFGVRLLAVISSVLALLGAVAFALFPARSPTMLPLFGVLAVVAYLPSLLLTLAWRWFAFFPDARRVPRPRDPVHTSSR